MKDIDKKNRVFINAVDIFVIILCLCCAGVGLFVTIYDYFEEPGQTFDVFVVIFGASIFLGAIILILSVRQTAVFGADGIEARRSHKIFFIRTEKIPYSEICKVELNYTSRFGWYAKIYYGNSTERKTIDMAGGTKMIELFVKHIPKVNYFIIGDVPSGHLELLYKLHVHDKRNVL